MASWCQSVRFEPMKRSYTVQSAREGITVEKRTYISANQIAESDGKNTAHKKIFKLQRRNSPPEHKKIYLKKHHYFRPHQIRHDGATLEQ